MEEYRNNTVIGKLLTAPKFVGAIHTVCYHVANPVLEEARFLLATGTLVFAVSSLTPESSMGAILERNNNIHNRFSLIWLKYIRLAFQHYQNEYYVPAVVVELKAMLVGMLDVSSVRFVLSAKNIRYMYIICIYSLESQIIFRYCLFHTDKN